MLVLVPFLVSSFLPLLVLVSFFIPLLVSTVLSLLVSTFLLPTCVLLTTPACVLLTTPACVLLPTPCLCPASYTCSCPAYLPRIKFRSLSLSTNLDNSPDYLGWPCQLFTKKSPVFLDRIQCQCFLERNNQTKNRYIIRRSYIYTRLKLRFNNAI